MGPYCLQYRLPKNKRGQKEADDKGLTLCIQENPKQVLKQTVKTHDAAFHQDLHCLLRLKQSSGT